VVISTFQVPWVVEGGFWCFYESIVVMIFSAVKVGSAFGYGEAARTLPILTLIIMQQDDRRQITNSAEEVDILEYICSNKFAFFCDSE
jgi:hypothetical protein